MKNKYKILAIMGKAGSGKSSLLRALLALPQFKDATPIISCTTRPIRDNETDGIDYHFLTNEECSNQVLSGEMLEATIFNNWGYGTSINNLSPTQLNIGVFNPEGIEILQDRNDIDLQVIYIEAADKVRLLRQLNREVNPDCHEIVRRFGTDEKDFAAAHVNPDITVVNNGEISIDMLAKTVGQIYINN